MDLLKKLELIDASASFLLGEIENARTQIISRNEAEFRSNITPEITKIAKELGVKIIKREEYGLKVNEAVGRADTVYNRVVIEYEAPGSLRPEIGHKHTAHSIGQIRDYIEALARKEHHKIDRLLGIVFDGYYFIFIRWRNEHWYIEPPEELNLSSVKKFLRLLFSLSSGRALIPENIVMDFGSQNVYTQKSTRAFYNALANSSNGLVQKLFEQWKIFFAQVTAYGESTERLKGQPELYEFVKQIGLKNQELDIPRFFFALHTQFSFVVKLIARLVLEQYAAGRLGATPMSRMNNLEGENFKSELKKIEEGDIFKSLGIKNLLEGDFFSWYLQLWNAEIEEALKETVSRLAEYNPSTIENDPFAARDLLKKLYHYLLPKELRHDLGEYYTPDWLAEKLFTQLGESIFIMPKGPDRRKLNLNKRLIDPACGSGTFPLLAIRALKENCKRQFLGESETLELILNNVAGIDINPLAVLASRVNYLLAISELLPYRKGEVEIPIYLADSILPPSTSPDLFGHGKRIFKTVVGDLPVPTTVNTSTELNIFTEILEECIRGGFSSVHFLERVRDHINPTPSEHDFTILEELYVILIELEKKGLDGVWAKVLKNAFMPLFLGEFDYVIGNPPWINWQNLPDNYRSLSSHLWNDYGLFVHSGMDTILGKGKKDISTLMTYAAVDRYLKNGGKLAFLVTQSVFKTSAGQGFRRFQIGQKGENLQVVQVDDLSELNPFEGASTKTMAFVIRKGARTRYPVPFLHWKKITKGKSLNYDSTLEEVLAMTKRFNYEAIPSDRKDVTSAWLTGRPLAIKASQKVLGKSEYKAHAGIYSGGTNAIFWLEKLEIRPDGFIVVKNIIEGSKKTVANVTIELEPDLLFPLLTGTSIQRWRFDDPRICFLVTQNFQTRTGIPLDEMQTKFPKTYLYLKRFEEILRQRAAYRRYFSEKDPFYSIFDVGDYTFKPYKVAWVGYGARRMGAVVIGSFEGKPILTNQAVIPFIGLDDEEEAHYVAAVMNSLPFDFGVISRGQVGGMSFAQPNVLEILNVPTYDSKTIQKRLALLSKKAHGIAKGNLAGDLNRTEEEINYTAAELYGINEKELLEIKRNYDELSI